MKLGCVVFVDDTGLEASFDIDEFALYEELFAAFGERSPGNTVRVFRFALVDSCSIAIVTIRRNGEEGYFLVSGSRFYIWILGNVSDEDNFIDSSHRVLRERMVN